MTLRLSVLVSCLGLPLTANAVLINRGFGLIYDTELGVTWLQDANYAKTSGFDDDGRMPWFEAVVWADQLVYEGYDDWRLPSTLDGLRSWGYDGTTTAGYNIATSEMGFMFFVNLGNLAEFDGVGTSQAGKGLTNAGAFVNLQESSYWSGTEYAADPTYAWWFSTFHGYQDNGFADTNYKLSGMYAWAVRDGDSVRHRTPDDGSTAMLLAASLLVCAVGSSRAFLAHQMRRLIGGPADRRGPVVCKVRSAVVAERTEVRFRRHQSRRL